MRRFSTSAITTAPTVSTLQVTHTAMLVACSLGFGYGLLQESAQSLILPDGCTWEEIAVPDLRIEVRPMDGTKMPIDECHKIGPCVESCEPCVWYADSDMAPTRTSERTDKSGGGAVGLPEGDYEVSASDDAGVVSKRVVRMKKGT